MAYWSKDIVTEKLFFIVFNVNLAFTLIKYNGAQIFFGPLGTCN